MSIGFTHHCQIITSVKNLEERFTTSSTPLPNSQEALHAVETFKNGYSLDFVNVEELRVRDAADINERVVSRRSFTASRTSL